ncbi:MAG: lmo0937 family membrane protein [bacterium]
MLLTIGIVLIALWLIGFIGFHVIGWFIHILLVIAIIMLLIRIIRGK